MGGLSCSRGCGGPGTQSGCQGGNLCVPVEAGRGVFSPSPGALFFYSQRLQPECFRDMGKDFHTATFLRSLSHFPHCL